MAGLAIAILFMLMVAAPCLVALRNSRDIGATEEYFPEEYFDEEPRVEAVVVREAEEFFPEELPALTIFEEVPAASAAAAPAPRVQVSSQRHNASDLREIALEAEMEALMAKNRADRAHWEALTATARAASLRADAAAEAAQAAGLAAERALRAAEAEFHIETEPQPQPENPLLRISGARRRAA